MIADVILGRNIDTLSWIQHLKEENCDNLFVLDYDYFCEPEIIENVMYISALDLVDLLKKYDSVNFYKSMYVYPGMEGNMSTLYKKR